MPQGIIVKGVSGFYYVKIDNRIVECKARGKFRNEGIVPLVGDIVEIMDQESGSIIEKVIPRKTELKRPPVSNVNQVVIVIASAKPEPNLNLLDSFLLIAEYNSLDIVICINKIDLNDIGEIEDLFAPYKDGGYSIVYTSTKTGYGLEYLKSLLKDKITVFAGPSGVGKSSLLNSLEPAFNMKTGELSSKIERGRHTTRHTELLELKNGGYVVDTPGFTSLDIEFINREEFEYLFPEFKKYIGSCKFTGCKHITEPGCAVKIATANNEINKKRYDSYVRIFSEVNNKLGR